MQTSETKQHDGSFHLSICCFQDESKVKFSMLISLILMNYTHLVCKVLNKNIEKTDLNIHKPNVNLISKFYY